VRTARPQPTVPTVIGQARPSHLVTTGGVGAIVDLPAMSVMVRGLEAWSPERAEVITEPRLLDQVRRILGPQVRAMRKAPWDPAAADDPWTRVGVPVSPFPRWVRCPRCFRLGPLDPPGQFELVHRWGRRPDLAKWVHTTCSRQAQTRPSNRKACLPARFLVACESGHLDDFPYVEYVHRGVPCAGPRLTMSDSSSTLGPRVQVKCAECGMSRSIAEAAGANGWQSLPLCRGRHPHLQRFETCGQKLRLMVLGASNLWFSVTASALHLPHDQSISSIVDLNWDVLGSQASPEVVQILVDQMDSLRLLRGVPVEEVWAAIEHRRSSAPDGGEPGRATGLLDAEWELLSRPTTDRQDDDFRAEVVEVPAGYDSLLDQVVQLPRLREVRALLGFTRILGPQRQDLQPMNTLPLTVGPPQWIPAVEQRGEGVFLQFREDQVRAWESQVEHHPRIEALRGSYLRWAMNRSHQYEATFPIARYLLLHTLSHLLIREIALECGYSSASVRERIYIGEPYRRYAGLLLSTAANDSEGTLGGLVALGQPAHLRRLLDQALTSAERCSTDPLCAEHVPDAPSDSLHAAACHACLFASETTCEANNRWLDRAVLVDITGDGLVFPR
jgi:hypothetical protein